MPTVKVRRGDGVYCFHCNAPVEEAAESCPNCGREFMVPGKEPPRRREGLGERVRLGRSDRKRGYKLAVLVLVALAIVSAIVFRGRGERPVFNRPEQPEVSTRVFDTVQHPVGRVERLSLFVVARPGLPEDSLRAVLDWLFFRTIDQRNRVEGGNLRVVWAYVYEDESAPRTGWRAMAIWQTPGLSESVRPSGIGAGGVRVGDVEYAFRAQEAVPQNDDDR